MATISNTWDDSTPASSAQVSEGDDRIREAKAAVRERLRNGGLYWADVSAAAASGVHFVSPDALVADHFIIYGNNAGVPDTNKKLEDLSATTKIFHADLTVNAAGTLQQAGSGVISKAGTKRILMLGSTGDARLTQPTDQRLLLRNSLIYVPQLNSGGGAITGTLKEVAVVAETAAASPAEDVSFDIKRQAGSGWASDAITTVAFTSVMASATTLKLLSGKTAVRVDDAAAFTGAVFPTIAGGDIFQVLSNRTGNNTFFVSVWLLIEVDWP